MNLTDILLFGKAIVGGDSGGKNAYFIEGTREEILAKYPVNEMASVALSGTAIKLSSDGLKFEELDRVVIGFFPIGMAMFSIALGNMVYMDETERIGVAFSEISGEPYPYLLTVTEDVWEVGNLIEKGLYLNIDPIIADIDGFNGVEGVYVAWGV